MPSASSNPARCAPQQDRSARRLTTFLEAAAELFVTAGFEGTTMTAIAERSGASIGALYHYFPDKKSIALALLNQYAQEIEQHWRPLIEQAWRLTHEEFADLFIERISEFAHERPAYLKLLAAPIQLSRSPAARRALRLAVAHAFQAKNPALSSERALLAAKVALQMVRGMVTLYTEAGPKEKSLVAAEFKKVLTLYLESLLSGDLR